MTRNTRIPPSATAEWAAGLRFATYLAPCNRPVYDWVARSCGAAGLATGEDWRELRDEKFDVAFVCSPPLVWLGGQYEALAAPVLTDPRFGGRPLYSSEVVVAAGSRFGSLADLRGRSWAVNEPASWSGFWVTLARVGEWRYFGRVVAAGSHRRALRMVAAGEVDGAAIDCQVLAWELRADPTLGAAIRPVETLGPAPIQPIVARASLDRTVKDRLSATLLGLTGPILKRHFVARLAPPPDYSPIAAVVGPAYVPAPPA